MSDSTLPAPAAAPLGAQIDSRTEAAQAFFADHAAHLGRLCHLVAERFAQGGRLLALGSSPAARSDARHVAVEFVHPVIVGKRALPALALTGPPGELERELELLATPADIVIAFEAASDAGDTAGALRLGRERGCLTIAFSDLGAEHELDPTSEDLDICQELVETLYHVLWELVHVFFEHKGLLEGRRERAVHDSGASAFLYPFLAEQEHDLDSVIADVERSVLMKAHEITELRAQTLREMATVLNEAATVAKDRLRSGGRVLALGNGGSATDATDLVADLRAPAKLAQEPRPAIDLTEDPGVLTAIANDIGVEAIFSRQVIAYGEVGDVLVTLSTSGNSVNVIEALEQARKRGMATIAFAGYDGGRIAAEAVADHVVITRSEHIPRIQEAQASAYHVLRELIG